MKPKPLIGAWHITVAAENGDSFYWRSLDKVVLSPALTVTG